MTDRQIPGRARIGFRWGLAAAAAAATVWLVLTGPDTSQTLVGYLLGLAATVLLTGRAGDLMRERRNGLCAIRIERFRQFERLARYTGTWTGPVPEQIFRARWNEGTRFYEVKGWLNAGTNIPDWCVWPDIEVLAQHLTGLENSGWAYGDDEGTTRVRAMLDLDPQPVDESVDEPGFRIVDLETGDVHRSPMHKPGPY